MSAFAMSANVQTICRESTEPTNTNTTQSQRYGMITFLPKRYSAAFSP